MVGRYPRGYDVVAARGNGNQRVFIVPKERLAITVFAGEYNKFGGHSERLFAAIMAARGNAPATRPFGFALTSRLPNFGQ